MHEQVQDAIATPELAFQVNIMWLEVIFLILLYNAQAHQLIFVIHSLQ